VNLAARGTRNMDTGKELIEDEDVKAQLRRQARWVYLKAILAASALTVICLLIPGR
jgi:hypothetical protein